VQVVTWSRYVTSGRTHGESSSAFLKFQLRTQNKNIKIRRLSARRRPRSLLLRLVLPSTHFTRTLSNVNTHYFSVPRTDLHSIIEISRAGIFTIDYLSQSVMTDAQLFPRPQPQLTPVSVMTTTAKRCRCHCEVSDTFV
jgi:hypothetical protein